MGAIFSIIPLLILMIGLVCAVIIVISKLSLLSATGFIRKFKGYWGSSEEYTANYRMGKQRITSMKYKLTNINSSASYGKCKVIPFKPRG